MLLENRPCVCHCARVGQEAGTTLRHIQPCAGELSGEQLGQPLGCPPRHRGVNPEHPPCSSPNVTIASKAAAWRHHPGEPPDCAETEPGKWRPQIRHGKEEGRTRASS